MFVNVRLLRPWNGHQPGRVFQDLPASSAELLVRRDVAEVVTGELGASTIGRTTSDAKLPASKKKRS